MSKRSRIVMLASAALLWTFAVPSAMAGANPGKTAERPAPDLAQAPAGSQTWVILGPEAQFGQSRIWVASDGTRWSRESFQERGYWSELDQQLRFNASGALAEMIVRGRTSSGNSDESFRSDGSRHIFRSPVDQGSGTARPNSLYVPFGGTLDATWLLAQTLLQAPASGTDLLPSGHATIERLSALDVSNGSQSKTLTLYAIKGLGLSPDPIWFDGDKPFGIAGAISILPLGWEAIAKDLVRAQETALAQRAVVAFQRIAQRPAGPVAFANVRLYDADARRFRQHMTVVVTDGIITAVGPARRLVPPAGTQVIDGKGKTLLPGLWDSHKHFAGDANGAQLLSQGITTIRDMGSVPETLSSIRRRIDANELLGPRVIPLLMIDGPGPLTDHVAIVVHNEEEGRAAVRRALAEGYAGIKIYGSLDPALIAPIARAAHEAGLRVQGHLPRTVRPLDAVREGYSELTHINFVLMQAMPDSVVDATNGLEQRHYGPMRHAIDADLNGPAFTAFIAELKGRGTVVDPTLGTFEQLWTAESGALAPAYTAFAGTLPPQFERGLLGGGLAPLDDLPRPAMRRAFEVAVDLVRELHRRGIPIVAGSDGQGFELIRELELYERAGLSAADAIASATIVPARIMGVDGETGSIAVGKRAELVLVNGDPGRAIGDLRNVDLVMRAGFLMRADALRQEAGLAPTPAQ